MIQTQIWAQDSWSPPDHCVHMPSLSELNPPTFGKPRIPEGWEYVTPVADTVDELFSQITPLTVPGWVFRGEGKCFAQHRPSLTRMCRATGLPVLQYECDLITRFINRSFALLSNAERAFADNVGGWQILMQHHGAPTRLLDWTESIWVAMYHACSVEPSADAFLWVMNPDPVTTHMRANVTANDALYRALRAQKASTYASELKAAGPFVTLCEPLECTERMLAQQSLYSIANPEPSDHMQLLGERLKAQPGAGRVLVVRSNLKRTLMQRMLQMNITGATLFPGIDGVGRHFRDLVAHGLAFVPIRV